MLAAPQDNEAHRLTAEHVSSLLDVLSTQTDYLFLDVSVMAGGAFHQESRLGTPVVISKPELLAAKALIELAEWLVENVPVATAA